MIILTSNGLSSNKLIDKVKAHIKIGKAALVVTADNEYKEKNYHVERLTKELKLVGLSVENFDLLRAHIGVFYYKKLLNLINSSVNYVKLVKLV